MLPVKKKISSKSKSRRVDRSKDDEVGPYERERSFLEERFSLISPKKERPKGQETINASNDVAPNVQPVAANFRLNLIRKYRELQSQQQAVRGSDDLSTFSKTSDKSTESKKKDFDHPELREVPLPPPANNWIPIGPSVLRQGQGGVKPATSGRTVGIAVSPGGNRVYIASANGGVWRSDDAGENWHSLMDAFNLNPTTLASDSLACGAIAVDLSNPDRVYVGTGEGGGGAYFGVGPISSIDGGNNWITELTSPGSPSLAGSSFYALAIDPADTNKVIAATERGLYRREADGAGDFHWTKKNTGSAATAVTSVVVSRSGNITSFYAAEYSGQIYSSIDGDNWSVAGTGFPANANRIGLAVQPSNPSVVYALTENAGVWRLDVSNNSWKQISNYPTDLLGSQGWYDLAIAVDSNNVNLIYLGGSTIDSGGDWSGSLYRSLVTATGSGANINYSMNNTFIGNSVHADIHTLAFAPGDSNKLWVGCDGGVFYSTNPTGSGDIFKSRNAGLATLTMNYMDQHPIEDAVIFCGTQDNGGERFTGEEAWLYSSGGDSGYFVINWNNPYSILSSYVYGTINRSSNGGQRYSYVDVSVPLENGEAVLFYAPLVGTPYNTTDPSQAEIVGFGSERPWISDTFGSAWVSIPTNSLVGDKLNERIKSLAFASANKLYAGTMSGGVYRFDRTGTTWSRTRIDEMGGNDSLPIDGVVTDIVIDQSNPIGDSIYITFGGTGDYRHVWHFDGMKWDSRSGPAAGNPQSLLDVQVNSIVVDPLDRGIIYVGADIGCWRSTDGGSTWHVFSNGLPDAAVMDLKIHSRRLIRASTHGRGVFERTLDSVAKQGIELYVRDTQLDQGRFTTIDNLPDPTNQGTLVKHWRGPDIKLDTPDINGQYQFPFTGTTINFLDFVDTLTDDFQNVATHTTENIITRVYVQVHNRGVIPANSVRVMLLIANASAGLPALPTGFDLNVRAGIALSNSNWNTVGIVTLNDIRVGLPKIADF